MIKVEVMDPEEAQALLTCVDPQQIYPEASLMHLNILVSSSQLQDQDLHDDTVYSAKSECPTPVGDSNSNTIDSDCWPPNAFIHSSNSSDPQQQESQPRPRHSNDYLAADTDRSNSVTLSSCIGRSNSIRMEEFQDLDVAGFPSLTDPVLDSANAENELNTPVFEKSNPFDLDFTATVMSLSQSSNINNTNNNNYSFNYVIKEEPTADRWLLDNVSEPSYTINVGNTTFNANNSILNSRGGSLLWPSTSKLSSSKNIMFVDDETTISDNSANNLNKIDVLDEYIIQARDRFEEEYETKCQLDSDLFKQECFSSDSSSCSIDAAATVPPRLILPDVPIPNLFASGAAVNTPDVITTIEEIEADNERDFNILHLVTEQDMVTSSDVIASLELPPTNTLALQSTSPHTTSVVTHSFLPEETSTYDYYGRSRTGSHTSTSTKASFISSKSSHISSKSPRRKRIIYDDDEDYIPPTKKRSERIVHKPKNLVEYESDLERNSSDDSSDSDDESVAYKNSKKAKAITNKRISTQSSTSSVAVRRGRPSGSSKQSNPSSPADKYREMRDKNNEASRKSRLKKKQQESHYSVEMEDMEMHNMQLKARVSELQKTVDSFRENLMKLMLSK